MKLYLKELLLFLSAPRIRPTIFGSAKLIGCSILLYYLIMLLSALIFKLIDSAIALPPHKSNQVLNNYSITYLLIIGLSVVPIIEETAFRLYLVYSRINLTISCSLLFYFLFTAISKSKLYHCDTFFFQKLILTSAAGILIYFLLKQFNDQKLKNKFNHNFSYLFYISVLLFSTVHLKNLSFENLFQISIAPILILPQIVLAIVLGYARCVKGLQYSVLIHALINLPIVLVAVASKM